MKKSELKKVIEFFGALVIIAILYGTLVNYLPSISSFSLGCFLYIFWRLGRWHG